MTNHPPFGNTDFVHTSKFVDTRGESDTSVFGIALGPISMTTMNYNLWHGKNFSVVRFRLKALEENR